MEEFWDFPYLFVKRRGSNSIEQLEFFLAMRGSIEGPTLLVVSKHQA